jgi:hypothetical protein
LAIDSSKPLAFRSKIPQQTQIPNKAGPSRAGTRHTLTALNHRRARQIREASGA